MTKIESISTASAAEFMVAGVNADGSVFRIGYAYSVAAAEKRVRSSKSPAAFARIEGRKASFEVSVEEKPGRVFDKASGLVVEGVIRSVAIKAA